MNAKKERLPYWDNLKGILILLVVFGHLLQLVPNGSETAVFKLIYLFHIPLFVFASGALSAFAAKKIVKSLLLPYFTLQTVCLMCTQQPVQFITPYWMLWYLPALAVWRLCIPVLARASRKTAPYAVLLLAVIGLSAGFVDAIGYAYTLSRILVFAPYFAAGYYAKRYGWFQPEKTSSNLCKGLFAAVFLVLCAVCVVLAPQIRAEWLYGTYGYAAGGYTLPIRAALYAAALILGCAMLILTPRKQTFFTAWGRESFLLYIAHIALLPAMQGLFPLLFRPLQYTVCAVTAVAFCAVIPFPKKQFPHLKPTT